METLAIEYKVRFGYVIRSSLEKETSCVISDPWKCYCIWLSPFSRMSVYLWERGTSFCVIRSPYRPYNFGRDHVKQSLSYACPRSLLESRIDLRTIHSFKEQALVYRASDIATPKRNVCAMEIEIITVIKGSSKLIVHPKP